MRPQAIEDLATGSVELTAALWDFYRRAYRVGCSAEVGLGTVNRYFLSDEVRALAPWCFVTIFVRRCRGVRRVRLLRLR